MTGMRTSTTIAISLTALLFGACGNRPPALLPSEAGAHGRADREPSAAVAAPSDMNEADFLVWTREGDGRTLTHRLNQEGRELAVVEGVFVGTPTGVWQWHEEQLEVATTPCARFDEEGAEIPGEPTEPGSVTRSTLVTRSGREQVVIDQGLDASGVEEIQHGVVLAASVGPFLFVEESTYAYSCGAHGNTSVASVIWDANEGVSLDMPVNLASLRGPRARAIRELSDEDDDLFPANEDNLELTELVPSFSVDATLAIGLQLTAPTCYACTHGGWGSYTKSTIVDAPVLPDLFAPYEKAPPAVRAFATAHPEADLGGWSKVTTP